MRLQHGDVRITIDHKPGQSISLTVNPTETAPVVRLRIPEAGGRADRKTGFELPGPPRHIWWGITFAGHDADRN